MPRARRGFALLIVLWALALLALLGSQLLAVARSDMAVTRNLRAGAAVQAAAYGALQEAVFHLLDTSGRRWNADGALHRIAIGAVRADVRVADEGRKLNLNLAPPRLLQALLLECGADPAAAASLVSAIVDWRTPGSQPHPGGAKAPQYAAAGLAYAPPGAPFRSTEELRSVLGMTPELLERLRPHLTVFTDTSPDRWSADAVVDAAIAGFNGARPPIAGNDAGPLIIATVSVRARGQDGGVAGLEAVVRLNARADGLPCEILSLRRTAV